MLGDGEMPLPLVYIDDVVDALVLAAKSGLAHGEVIQVVDPEPWTQNQVLAEVHGTDTKVVRIPRAAVFAMGGASEMMLGLLGKKSPLSRYRLQVRAGAASIRRPPRPGARSAGSRGWASARGFASTFRRRRPDACHWLPWGCP